ncbi:MAG: glyoxalase [Ascidiaceihabitans sp.]
MRPKGENGTSLLLAQASNPEQSKAVGAQSGGRVFLFLETDDFWQDYNAYVEKGIEFAQPPVEAEYGTVAVFKECHSNLWDLIQYNKSKSA